MPETTVPPLVWLPPEQNSFGVRVLDCRDFCKFMKNANCDPGVSQRFAELRRSSGEEHRGRSPQSPRQLPCKLCYRLRGGLRHGSAFRAKSMEDKWDIFFFENALYFARSWTGELAFRAQVRIVPGELSVNSIEAGADGMADEVHAIQHVDFLIKCHLLRLEVPHPLPESLPDDPFRIAVYSFRQYGRWAAFATYADTTQFGTRPFDPEETLM